MNVFTFTGHLGKDAEQRFTGSGESIISFSVPVKSGYGDKQITSWLKCSMFGKRSESVLPYLKKGQLVGVSGEFAARPWKNKEGQDQVSNEVRVNDITLLGSKQQDAQQAIPPAKAQSKTVSHGDDLDSDVPF